MTYRIKHTTEYRYEEAVPVCHNLLHLTPRSLPHQSCDDYRLLIQPEPADYRHDVDYFGNSISYFSIDHAHRGLSVTAISRVKVTAPPALDAQQTASWDDVAGQIAVDRSEAGLSVYEFVVPSRYVRPFPALRDYTMPSFPPGRPILAAVIDLTARIHNDFTYDPRATTVYTSIEQVLANRHGVCQDFAHLQIGCLRSMGLAARYVSGYLRTEPPPGKPRLVGADASHAWLSVFCGGAGWVDVDPTNNVTVSTDHVTVAWGTDYHDVCPVQGVIVGGGAHTMNVSVDVIPEKT
jgi:transglutaminase-like putative cysteine protease